jgi:hypothetical protein
MARSRWRRGVRAVGLGDSRGRLRERKHVGRGFLGEGMRGLEWEKALPIRWGLAGLVGFVWAVSPGTIGESPLGAAGAWGISAFTADLGSTLLTGANRPHSPP